MNSFDWSAVISGIALIVAIISPIATTILANRHQDKVWNRSNYTLHRSDVIEQYIKNTGALLKSSSRHELADYGKYYGEIFFYTSAEEWEMIEEIDKSITARQIGAEDQQLFNDLCKKLSVYGKRPEK